MARFVLNTNPNMTQPLSPAATRDPYPADRRPDSLQQRDTRASGAVPKAGSPTQPAVTLHHVTLQRGGRPVLHDLSLSFRQGTITVLVGCSGVGKSTLMRALNGLVAPASGYVSIAGAGRLDDPASLREARRSTATIFQDHALIDRLPAIDNVLLGLADMRHPLSPLPWPRSLRLRAAEALNEVGLLSRATARAGQLSGGERQRVGIARALVRRPGLLLGDEPFASVDQVLARQLGAEFRRLVVRNGLTVILVLHQIPLARTLGDRIIGLADGGVAFEGTAAGFDAEAEHAVFSRTPHSHPDTRSTPCSPE